MLKFRRKHCWYALAGAVPALLLLIVTVAAPLYLSSAGVKQLLQRTVQEKLGGKVSYETIDISLFPRPRVTVTGIVLAYPRTFKGTLRSISVAPQVLPLFKGRVAISKVRIDGPDFRISLPSMKTDTTSEAPTLTEVKDDIRAVLGYLELVGPGLEVEMDNGKFLLRRNRRDFLDLRDVTIHFNAPPGDMRFLVKAGTGQWGAFTLKGTYAFTETQTEIRDLTLGLGRSSLSDWSALLTWDSDPRIEIRSGRAEFALQEIYEWLKSVDSLTPFMKELSSLKGSFVITSMTGQGLLSQPDKLRMRLTGDARRIELESPRLPAPVAINYSFAVEDNMVELTEFSARMGSSSLSHVSARLSGRDDPVLDLRSGTAKIDITEVFGWRTWHPALEQLLQGVDILAGAFSLTELRINGKLHQPLAWKVLAAGEFDHIQYQAPLLPGPASLVKGTFRYNADKLTFGLKEASILDSTITGTAVVSDITTTVSSVDVTLEGSSGKRTVDWAFEKFTLPPGLMLRTPLALSNAHLVWERDKGASFSGTASVAGGLLFDLDLSQQGEDLDVRQFRIRDPEADASFSVKWQKQAADLSFSGNLAQSSLSRIFEKGNFGSGTMQGKLHSVLSVEQPLRSRVQGSLTGRELFVPGDMPIPTTLNRFALHAAGDVLTLDAADVTWGRNHYSLTGAVTTSDEGIAFSMKLNADGIDIDTIQQALAESSKKTAAAPDKATMREKEKEKENGKEKPEQQKRTLSLPPVRGDFQADSDYIKYGRFILAPAHVVMTVEPGRVGMEFSDTRTCGVNLAGAVIVTQASSSFTFSPSAKDAPLGPTIDCLSGKDLRINGSYDLIANIRSHGTGTDMLPALEGRIDFAARDGKIYHFPTLAKVLSVLSVLEIFRGQAPELGGSGFPYHSMAFRGNIHQGVFTIEECYIGGKSLDIIAEGEVDLARQKIDVTVLVAPFSSINWLIRRTPVLGTIMGGTLISIPSRVSGDLRNPDVVVLSPTAIGSRLMKTFSNIIKAPVVLFSDEKGEK